MSVNAATALNRPKSGQPAKIGRTESRFKAPVPRGVVLGVLDCQGSALVCRWPPEQG